MEPLLVEVVVGTNPHSRLMPAPVSVRLTNQQTEPVLINRRLAIGYRDTHDRELFAELFARGQNDVMSIEARDYQRNRPQETDYVWLQPAESVSTSFDLFRWYTLPGPGGYDLVINYRADDARGTQPEGLLNGVYSSDRVAFDVI